VLTDRPLGSADPGERVTDEHVDDARPELRLEEHQHRRVILHVSDDGRIFARWMGSRGFKRGLGLGTIDDRDKP
jgi:hypothetical protein